MPQGGIEQGFIGFGHVLAATGLDGDLVGHPYSLVVGYNAGVQKILIVGSGDVARRILSRLARHYRVYALLSDGELNEGSTWEAVMSASHWKLDNLIAIVDVNNQQADGHSSEVLAFEPIVDRWQAFGWFTQRVDGNDLDALVKAFDAARSHPGAQPRVIICDTKMGKGVPFLETREKTHFIRVDEHEWDVALNNLEEGKTV